MELSNYVVKIEKCKLLQNYTYNKTTPYVIEKTKPPPSPKFKQKKMLMNSWTIDCFFAYFAD